jgi:hypothetical protein
MKQLENNKETGNDFIGNIDCNISAASGAPITVKKMASRVQNECIGRAVPILGPLDQRTILRAASTYGVM